MGSIDSGWQRVSRGAGYGELAIEFHDIVENEGTFATTVTLKMTNAPTSEALLTSHTLPSLRGSAEWTPDSLALALRASRVAQRYEASTTVQGVGAVLFDALMMTRGVQQLYSQLVKRAAENARFRARIRLVFPVLDPDDPRRFVELLPWEAMYDGFRKDFVGLLPRVSIYRALPVSGPCPSAIPGDAPSMLVVTTETKAKTFRSEEEREKLAIVVGKEHLEPPLVNPSAATFLEALRDTNSGIVHVAGHVESRAPQGLLLPTRDRGLLDDPMPAVLSPADFVQALHENKDKGVWLVFLNACNSALLGTALLREVPAVVGIQGPISVDGSIEFAEAFYESLVAGASLEVAMAKARRRVDHAFPGQWDWALPSLFAYDPGLRIVREDAAPKSEAPSRAQPLSDGAASADVSRLLVQQQIIQANLDALARLMRETPHGKLEEQSAREQAKLKPIMAALDEQRRTH